MKDAMWFAAGFIWGAILYAFLHGDLLVMWLTLTFCGK